MDARGRRLQRSAATGDPEAAAALLVQRVRRGELPRQRLELLAYLGSAAAQRALHGDAPPAPVDDLSLWVFGLEQWGTRWVLRAALSAAGEAVAAAKGLAAEDTGATEFEPLEEALACGERCWEEPNAETREAALRAAGKASRVAVRAGAGAQHWAAHSAHKAAEALGKAPALARSLTRTFSEVEAALSAAARACRPTPAEVGAGSSRVRARVTHDLVQELLSL